MSRCLGLNSDGSRCRYRSEDRSNYCVQHGELLRGARRYATEHRLTAREIFPYFFKNGLRVWFVITEGGDPVFASETTALLSGAIAYIRKEKLLAGGNDQKFWYQWPDGKLTWFGIGPAGDLDFIKPPRDARERFERQRTTQSK